MLGSRLFLASSLLLPLLSTFSTVTAASSRQRRTRRDDSDSNSNSNSDPDRVTVPSELWGFINPAGQLFDNNVTRSSWQRYSVGQQLNISWIAPFSSVQIELVSEDGKKSAVLADNEPGPLFSWIVDWDEAGGSASDPSPVWLLHLSAGSSANTDTDQAHSGIAYYSSRFNLTDPAPPNSVFGKLSGWSFGTLIAILFTGLLLLTLVLSLVHRCASKRKSASYGYSSGAGAAPPTLSPFRPSSFAAVGGGGSGSGGGSGGRYVQVKDQSNVAEEEIMLAPTKGGRGPQR